MKNGIKKHNYAKPLIYVTSVFAGTELLEAVSGVQNKFRGIGYGGLDSDGSKTPSSRQYYDIWDDEDDDY